MLHYASNLDPQIHLAFTSQAEGNLALHVNDDPQLVRANRARLEERIGVRSFSLTFMNQVHSATVLNAEQRAEQQGAESAAATCDGLISPTGTTPLAVMVADCLPVLLSDPVAGVVAAAHAGRQGLLAGVLQQTIAAMTELGARPEQLEASIGPSICGACYEVPAALREEAAALLPATWAHTSWGTPSLDLRAGAAAVLEAAGVPRASVDAEHPCTLEDERFYSYRRHPRTGRFAGVVRRA